MVNSETRVKALLVIQGRRSPELFASAMIGEKSGTMPRFSVFENELGTICHDLKMIDQAPLIRRMLYRFMPQYLALAIEVFRIRKDYDVVVTWSEQVTIFFALLQTFSRVRKAHVAMIYWMSKPNIKGLLRLVHRNIDCIVTWSSRQRDLAITTIGIPAKKITLVQHHVDQLYWTAAPSSSPPFLGSDFIMSAGAEMRDFSTLIAAVEGTEIVCRIAAKEIRIPGRLRARILAPEQVSGSLPPNLTLRPAAPIEVRELYRNCRFVVVPLLETDTDNGVTVILEAMSCGKAVICTRTRGQKDTIEHGVTGIFVEPDSPSALREAILHLWNNPAEAARLGKNARTYIEQSRHPTERFCSDAAASVRRTAAQVAAGDR